MIENVNLFIAAVHNVHIFLLGIARKSNPPSGTAGIGQSGRTRFDPNIALKLSRLIEDLDPVALTGRKHRAARRCRTRCNARPLENTPSAPARVSSSVACRPHCRRNFPVLSNTAMRRLP